MVNLENLEDSLAEIRQAAREYYARKNGSWKPKRDLDAEHLEDMARYRRESMMLSGSIYHTMRMMRYVSGPEKTIVHHVAPDPEKIERIRKAFEMIDLTALEERIKSINPDIAGRIILDELPDSRRIPEIPELKDYQHKFLYGEWVEPPLIGAGKNPFAEHTIRGVKKSHRKRGFSKKSRRGIMLQG